MFILGLHLCVNVMQIVHYRNGAVMTVDVLCWDLIACVGVFTLWTPLYHLWSCVNRLSVYTNVSQVIG